MPEGDTLFRTATGLRPYLVGRRVSAARTAGPGPVPRVERIVGQEITGVESLGKNLLIRFGNGLEIRTHLRMNGSWHRYRPGEPWRRPPGRARLVLEVPGAVAVCFDAPVVELLERRAEAVHPSLGRLGPDLLAPDFEPAEAVRRLRDPARAATPIGEALVDQRALAGIGNVYKSEVLWLERVAPTDPVGALDDATLSRLVATAHGLLRVNASRNGGPERVTTGRDRRAVGPLYAYGRARRPCRRCGTPIRSMRQGVELPRTTYWCPACQPAGALASASGWGSTRRPRRSSTSAARRGCRP
ncbi:MAG: Fpg/Nei family DNA glycosylase [Chloroflexi bacterium]|nr:Fpg/Nei family DNA glycosylase [Chloroflexota bacterium]